MKKRNQYREKGEEKVRSLVQSFGYVQRLKDLWARKRILAFLKKAGMVMFGASFVVYGGYYVYQVVFDKTQELRISKIDFHSIGIINQQEALKMMDLELDSRMANFSSEKMTEKLQAHPLIASARVYAELPNTVHISIKEHLPIVYVQKKNDLKSNVFFIDQEGIIFPVDVQLHQEFLNSPTWHINDDDCQSFELGGRIKQSSCQPIIQLVSAINAYELVEIPRIKDIYRPKEWKIVFSLESGCQVMMKSFDIESQTERLYQIIEHAKATKRQLRSVNVIPHRNPAVTFF